MLLNKNEKKYLAELVQKQLEHVQKDKKRVLEGDVAFLKGEHELEDFLKGLQKKLGE